MSVFLRTDVTSVKISEQLIFAGIGSSVNIFEKNSSELLQRILCLNGQKIYGLVPSKCGQKILVFGGKQFTVITGTARNNETELFTRCFEPIVCDDWLHSALWLDADNIVVLTAHNVVQTWNTSSQNLASQHCSRDNSILYSGLVLLLNPEVLVLAGTVFSEIIVHVPGEEPLHRLEGHKGVIFSISCDLQKGIIVTTSDDRSVRIWGPNSASEQPCNTIKFWKKANIVCKQELYGHSARVMRSCISSDLIVSVGEDSAICFWNHDGSLAKKIMTHQNGCIWSVDFDSNILVTGGGDCAVLKHPLSLASEYGRGDILDLQIESPKKVVFTARRNIVILNEHDDLIFYEVEGETKSVHRLNHESTNKLISVSSCKQMIAVADMNGKLDVFIENCKDRACLINIIDTKLSVNRILSMQWAGNRHLVLCLENGAIKVLASKESSSESYTDFLLPNCKERWLTASAVDSTKKIFMLGDRCGNIHVYIRGQKNPVKTFSKVHGRYGPTSITIRKTDIVTTGRDGTVQYFTINKDKVKLMCRRDLEFKWIEKFLDKEENIVCGFQERVFVVYDMKYNLKLLEVSCGGGHRSWDAIRYFEKVDDDYEEFIKLIYLKVSEINVVKFQLSKVASKNIINGTHFREINCLKTYQNQEHSAIFFISGGEDTTLRISFVNTVLEFEEVAVFKQLSSIRTLKICTQNEDSFLLISAGGRAQICIKIISFVQRNNEIILQTKDLIDYMIKGSDKARKGCQSWKNCAVDFDPETRIMDVDYNKLEHNKLRIFAGCSDATLRIFTLNFNNDEVAFELTNEVKYHKTCILKTNCVSFANKDMLVTSTTRGQLAIWDVSNISDEIEPIFVTTTNKSGINSFASTALTSDRLLIATGGDDNAMQLLLLHQTDQASVKVLDTKILDKHHSSQITGLCFVDEFILSASVDQRITLFKWAVDESDIRCTFLSQMYTDVADVQGMDLVSRSSSSITVCVYGKGMEVVEMAIPSK